VRDGSQTCTTRCAARSSSTRREAVRLDEQVATLVIRPRGWHLVERHHEVDDKPVSASLFDFGLVCFNNAKSHARARDRPYFYLPKLESHEEARLWARAFAIAEDEARSAARLDQCTC